MSAWWRIMNRGAIVIAAVAIVVWSLESIAAIGDGQIVVGWTYWRAPVFAILQLIVCVVAALALILYARRHWDDTAPPRSPDDL